MSILDEETRTDAFRVGTRAARHALTDCGHTDRARLTCVLFIMAIFISVNLLTCHVLPNGPH
jgi:hypothetical protein